ncbi:MAG: ATP-dependent sacrificial sulfur transferase LarE [Actinomycetota bacterium]
MATTATPPSKLDTLERVLRRLRGAAIAFSGGADSAFLAFVAHRTLGDDMVAVTADSPSLPRRELAEAAAFAREHGIPHRVVPTSELADPRYAKNAGDRCAWCKEALMDALLTRDEFSGPVLLGVNIDDLRDHRPGQARALHRGARFPLVEAGLSKGEIRSISRTFGLSTWNKPAAACLSSRIAYGVPVTEAALARVERAEEALRGLGFSGNLRVRDHGGDLARIEVDLQEVGALLRRREEVVRALKEAGFRFVTVDLEGYRSGSQNVLLTLGTAVRASVDSARPPNRQSGSVLSGDQAD